METGLKQRYQLNLLNNYGTPPIALLKGSGSTVDDEDGKSYLDFSSGIAVNALGHAHPEWIDTICKQAHKLTHCSNLFINEPQIQLAEALAKYTPKGKFFFCNSGTEANEALIKLARLHGIKRSGSQGKHHKILCAENAFHGRTFGGMSATPKEKVQNGFHPLLDGFDFAPLNNLDAFKAKISTQTSAILLETIQGEGGICCADSAFLQGIEKLCREHNLLLLIDEVQCGIGRSGKFFAYEHHGITPDAIGMAKGLGGGFPIGGIWVSDAFSNYFTPGSHGSTFGGNPLACAAALATLKVIEDEKLTDQITKFSQDWHTNLTQLCQKYPLILNSTRGIGYLYGIQVKVDPIEFVSKLRENGLLTVAASEQVVRLLPPLNINKDDLSKCVDIIDQTCQEWQ